MTAPHPKPKQAVDGDLLTITCSACGHEVNGADHADVVATHNRHVDTKRCGGGKA